jgi:hypothetical protein
MEPQIKVTLRIRAIVLIVVLVTIFNAVMGLSLDALELAESVDSLLEYIPEFDVQDGEENKEDG